MSTVAELLVKLGMDASGLDSGMSNSAGKLKSWGESLTSAGKKLTAGVTLPLAGAGLMAVKWASDLEQAKGKTEAVFQGATQDVLEWSRGSADAYGLAQSDALALASGVGALFTVVGATTDQAAGFSKEIIGTAADMAAFNDVTTTEALDAYQSALLGQYIPLRRMGVFLNEDKVNQEALNIAHADGRTEVTDYDKVLARHNLIQQQSAQQAGSAAREHDGFASSIQRVQARAKNLGATFGQILMPYVLGVMSAIERLMAWFTNLNPAIQKLIVVIAAVAAAIGPLLLGLGTMLTLMAGVPSAIAAVIGILSAFAVPILLIVAALAALGIAYKTNLFGFRDAVNGLASNVLGKVRAIADGVAMFAKIVKTSFDLFRARGENPLEAALNATSRGVDYLARRVPALAGPLKKLSNGLKSAAKQVKLTTQTFKAMKSMWGSTATAVFKTGSVMLRNWAENAGPLAPLVLGISNALGIAGDMANTFGKAFSSLRLTMSVGGAAISAVGAAIISVAGQFGPFEGAVQSVGKAVIGIGTAVDQGFKGFKDLLSGDYASAATHFGNALSSVRSVVSNLGDAAKSAFGTIKDMFQGVDWGGVLDTIMASLGSLVGRLRGWYDDAVAWAQGIDWAGMWSTVKDVTGDIVGKLGDLGTRLYNWVRDATTGAGTWLLDTGPKIIDGLQQGLTSAWSTIQGWASGIADRLRGAIDTAGSAVSWLRTHGSDAIEGIRAGFDERWPTVQAWVEGIGDRIKSATNRASEWFKGVGQPAIDGLLTDLKTSIAGIVGPLETSIQSTIDSLKPTVKAAFERLFDFQDAGWTGQQLGERFGDWLNGLDWSGLFGTALTIQTKLSEAIGKAVLGAVALLAGIAGQILAFLGGFLVGLFERIEWGPAVDALVSAGQTLISGLLTGIGQFWPSVEAWATTIGSVIANLVGDFSSWLVTQGIQLLNGLITGIGLIWPTVSAWASNLGPSVVSAVGSLASSLEAKGQEILQGFLDGLNNKWPTVSAWLGQVGTLASAAVGKLGSTLLAHGTELIGGFWTGMISKWSSVSSWLVSLRNSIAGAVGYLGSILWDAGASLMNGLWEGAKSVWSSLAGWLSEKKAEIAALKGPPREDARVLIENGRLIMQGFGVGLSTGWGGIERQLAGYTADLSGMLNGTLDRTAAQGAGQPIYNVQVITLEPGRWREFLDNAMAGGDFARNFGTEVGLYGGMP